MSTQSLASVKARLSEVVSSVRTTHERVTITRNGEPAAVLISPDDLESLEETLAILTDPEALAALREGEAAAHAGDVLTEAAVRALLSARPGR